MKSSALMLGAQHYRPSDDDRQWGWIFGGFIDRIRFYGNSGYGFADPAFVQNPPFRHPFDLYVTNISGDAVHAGLSLARTHRLSDRWAWQAGLTLEYYAVHSFRIQFDTRLPSNNFSGELNYASTYNTIAPYIGYRYFFPESSSTYVWSSRIMLAWPFPHRGFHGHITGPGFDLEGDSDQAGNGKHIPDPFGGVGLTVESVQKRWRLDLGSSLWLFLVEGQVHKGNNPPLFVHFSWPF